MKICFLITGLGIGGAEKYLLNLVPQLKFDKLIISLTNKSEFGKELEKKGEKIYYLGLNKFNLPLVLIKFFKIIIKENPDILDTYLIHSNLFGRVFGRIFGIKKIISSIRSDYSDFKILKFIDKLTQNLVNLYILNSRALLNYTYNLNQIPLNKIIIIPNGIDLKRIQNTIDKNFNIREELGLEKNSFIIVSVARLIKEKNLSTLIKAMKLINKNLFLVIVGDGPERKILQKISEKLNLKNRIFFLGTRKDVLNIVNSSNVFILPSLREGMSNALMEAMALKKICIVSNIAQNKELIKDNINGITFYPKNENELAKKILEIYKNEHLRSLGEEASKLIKERYDIKIIIKKYEKIIENILINISIK